MPRHDSDQEDATERQARDEAAAAKKAEPVGKIPPGPRPNTDEFVTPRQPPATP